VKPNTIVQYKGGGYDGCYWEWNYAYFDGDGRFHNLIATGRKGCKTEEELRNYLDTTKPIQDYDLYALTEDGEVERFGRETPFSHLIMVAQTLADNFNVELTITCNECGDCVPVVDCDGAGTHGVGGIMMEYDELLCESCHSSGSCCYCGTYVGKDSIDGETGYCTGHG
jgi:hypothetical protein